VDTAQGVAHRVHNTGHTDLVFVEVQTGDYFGEDDIVRLADDYGR
jgi:mannose-6-phosphate isomerase